MLLIIVAIVSFSNVAFATATAIASVGADNTNAKVVEVGSKIVPIVRTIGIVAAIVILMIVGIKYMMGSAEEKAEYKKTMPAYVIGAVLVFAASTVLTWIYDMTSKLS